MKILITLFLVLLLTSCASLNPLSILEDKPKIETNLNVGENVSQEQNKVKSEIGNTTSTQEAEKITNDTNTNIQAQQVQTFIQQLTWWQQLLLVVLAGAALPSFKEMYSGIKIVVADICNAFIVTPIKGVANFILTLFGRN